MGCSSWADEEFVLEFSDNEGNNRESDESVSQDSKSFYEFEKVLQKSITSLNDHADLHTENHFHLNELKVEGNSNDYIDANVDEDIKPNVALEFMSLPTHPSDTEQTSSFKSVDTISGKTVNFSKLMNQLSTAKVVIEKICVSPKESPKSAKDCALPKKRRPVVQGDYINRYCPKCKTIKKDSHQITSKKCCRKCKTTMLYCCSKCNVRYLRNLGCLRRHEEKCSPNAPKAKKYDSAEFLVKKNKIDISKNLTRYCSSCNVGVKNCEKSTKVECKKCEGVLLYQCNKCQKLYKSYDALLYHTKSMCYPDLYKCNQCDFTNPTWKGIHRHILNIHCRVKTICPKCNREYKSKESQRKHFVRCRLARELICYHCSYVTRYKYALKSHIINQHDTS